MQYRSVLSNQALRKQTMIAIKGNRWRLFWALLVQIVVSGVFAGLAAVSIMPLGPLPTLPNPVSLVVNFRVLGPAIAQAVMIQVQRPMTIVVAVGLLLIQFIMVQLWVYGLNHAFLEMVDTGRFRYGTVWRAFKERPLRHFITAWLVSAINGALTLLYLLSMGIVGVFFYITLLTVQSPTIATWLGIAVVLLYVILAILLLILFALLLYWISYGLRLFMYPSYDVKTTSIGRSLAMSWRLMRGNKWQLFLLGLRYALWPLLGGALAAGAYLLFGGRIPSEYLVFVFSGGALIFYLWVLAMAVRFLVAQAVFYRDQTEQYARRLNEQYPGFNATPKASLTERYHTEDHPRFTADTVAIELPDNEEVGEPARAETVAKPTAGPRKYRVKTKSPKTTEAQPEAADPGYRLDDDGLEEPIAAKDIFNGEDAPTSDSDADK